MSWLTDPFQYDFMQRALLASVLVGVLSPVVGVWLVLRRVVYLGDAMSHASLAGVAIAYGAGVSVVGGALAAGAVVATLLVVLSGNRRLKPDAIIGVVSSTMFAIGVVVISRIDSGRELTHFLFGQVLTVTKSDVVLSAAITAIAVVVIATFFGDLKAASFDEMHARQVGIRVTAIHYGLLLLLAAAVVVSLRTVGTLMAVSMLITPAATARLVTNTARTMTLTAVAIGVSASATGLVVQYHLSSSPGATIALVVNLVFAVVFAATLPRRMRHHVRPTA